jgi:hypothetical protein
VQWCTACKASPVLIAALLGWLWLRINCWGYVAYVIKSWFVGHNRLLETLVRIAG